jgi:hypothetical protein
MRQRQDSFRSVGRHPEEIAEEAFKNVEARGPQPNMNLSGENFWMRSKGWHVRKKQKK